MKKKYYQLLLIPVLILTLGFFQKAAASHAKAAELTYTYVAPNTYQIIYIIYRDCSSPLSGPTASAVIQSPGCNAGRQINLNQINTTTLNDFFCPQVAGACNNNAGYQNLVVYTYAGTVTFTSAETACHDWVISASECSRPTSVNLTNSNAYCLYAEAYLNLSAGINNSSPQFSAVPALYVTKSTPVTLSHAVVEPDGDSLVYSLKPALDSYNAPIPYESFSGSGIIFKPGDSTKIAYVAGAGIYSATFPIFSYNVDWNTAPPYTKTQSFFLDPKTGSMSFTPSIYDAVSPPVAGKNKYVVVVQIDEYRRNNGLMVKVGSVRRDMQITVVDSGPNVNPTVTSPAANGVTLTPGTLMNLRPGATLNFQVNSSDANAGNILEMSSDAAQMLPGSTFSVSTANQPTGTLTWTPTAAQVRSQLYYFHVTVKDNACPVRGFQTQTYGVRVSNSGSVTGTKSDLNNQLSFIAYPNPFTEKVSFKVNLTSTTNQEIQIYNTLGKLVDKISLKNLPAGAQEVVWEKGSKLANGNYLAKLVKENQITQTIQFSKMQ